MTAQHDHAVASLSAICSSYDQLARCLEYFLESDLQELDRVDLPLADKIALEVDVLAHLLARARTALLADG